MEKTNIIRKVFDARSGKFFGYLDLEHGLKPKRKRKKRPIDAMLGTCQNFAKDA